MTKQGPRILTGHRPTGPRHMGHLVGTLQNWVKLQDTHECFFLVADLHVLTTDFEHTASIRQNTLEMAYDWLAAGIDPQRSTLILQSAVPAHALLCTLLGMLVTASRLERVPTYKEQVQRAASESLAGSAGLPGAAGGRYPDLQSQCRAGWRRPAPPPRTDPRTGAPFQPALWRYLSRTGSAALGLPAPAGHR